MPGFVYTSERRDAMTLAMIFTVRLVPPVELLADAPVMVHWLLVREAVLPRVMGPTQAVPASFCRRKVLAARLNSRARL